MSEIPTEPKRQESAPQPPGNSDSQAQNTGGNQRRFQRSNRGRGNRGQNNNPNNNNNNNGGGGGDRQQDNNQQGQGNPRGDGGGQNQNAGGDRNGQGNQGNSGGGGDGQDRRDFRPRTRVTRVTRKKKFKKRGGGGGEDNRGGGGGGGGRNHDHRQKFYNQPMEEPSGPATIEEGLLEISGKGFGFLRQKVNNYNQTPQDVFVTPEIVRNFGLRDGMWVKAEAKLGSRGPQLTQLLKINGMAPDSYKTLPWFEELKAINPNKRITLETTKEVYTTRVIDLMAPIGRGQRGLIVAPPRTGKTTILQNLAEAVIKNHPQMKVIVLLVDERPEEVTELTRALPDAEIMASSNDSDIKAHTRIAQMAIERAKRLVEAGEHVFMLLDSITRLARSFNNAMKDGGRTGSGGLDVRAMEIPRRLFAAARNTRDAGSLTIIGTALIETNSRMDDIIFQEFKGTGNMELVLDRSISQQYIYPAIDILKSGTRREELLLPPHYLEKIYLIRRGLAGHKPVEAIERLLGLMEKFPSNAQMLMEIKPMH
jgi:transcription termination factor Rho